MNTKTSTVLPDIIPGSIAFIRSENWKILSKAPPNENRGYTVISCKGISGITKNKLARFVWEFEDNPKILDPAKVNLVVDKSDGMMDSKLFLESAFRSSPTTTRKPLTLGQAAIDDLKFQHLPVEKALNQDRVRLLIADDVGLGKTLEAGLITSELILRGRAKRILVVTTRAMLTQFQKEFWTRFSIPLARLDSSAISRMRNKIPAHYNVFDQFDRSIVSIDTLKKDGKMREDIKESYWDLIIIDEAHNAANRSKSSGKRAQRARLAMLLSRKSDSLLLLTATPHDGSHESFASLIEMLDPTRVPDHSNLKRDDIEDLVVRRFRTSPDVQEELKSSMKKRKIHSRYYPLHQLEDEVYHLIAELKLDIDENKQNAKANDLFRTTLAKSIFSSPAACLATLTQKIRSMENDSSNSKGDLQKLEHLRDLVESIKTEQFNKYGCFLKLLEEENWNGKDPRDRLVIFTERIATVSWLYKRLMEDLGFNKKQIARIDGGSVEKDRQTQETLEQFGQENTPLRILIASEMASEGLNLHYQCFRLIHFDLPWSLLRFQQRNGRIDRYGQDREPQIYYFVGESSHPKVRQMWVLDKLVEKDIAVQKGLGDPSVFLGKGDIESEVEKVAEVVLSAMGKDKFDSEMENKADEIRKKLNVSDQYKTLFGGFNKPTILETNDTDPGMPPRLFEDTFTYASEMLRRLSKPDQNAFREMPDIREADRLIRLQIPIDMCATDSLGYAQEGAVDEKYMPIEAVGRGNKLELTDNQEVITQAIANAKMEERSWPIKQFLWDGHPILNWFGDRAETLFPNFSAPVANLKGRLEKGEISVVIHGTIPNVKDTPVVDNWAVVNLKLDGSIQLEEVSNFIERVRLFEDTPNSNFDIPDGLSKRVSDAVNHFQDNLVKLRKIRQIEIDSELEKIKTKLKEFENRFYSQLSLKFPDIEEQNENSGSKIRRALRDNRRKQIDELFKDWIDWFKITRYMTDDPNPFVSVKTVFVG